MIAHQTNSETTDKREDFKSDHPRRIAFNGISVIYTILTTSTQYHTTISYSWDTQLTIRGFARLTLPAYQYHNIPNHFAYMHYGSDIH